MIKSLYEIKAYFRKKREQARAEQVAREKRERQKRIEKRKERRRKKHNNQFCSDIDFIIEGASKILGFTSSTLYPPDYEPEREFVYKLELYNKSGKYLVACWIHSSEFWPFSDHEQKRVLDYCIKNYHSETTTILRV